MVAERTVGYAWVRGIVELFEALGLDVPALFRDAGLDIPQLEARETRFPPDKISTLWELAALRSGNPYVGLALPEVVHPASFDMVVHLMMTCPNLRTGIERLLRYIRIVSDAADMSLHEEAGGYGLTITLEGGGRSVPRARVEFVLVTIFNILRWLSGRNLRPLAVDFPYPAPADLEPYRHAFNCPLRFDAQVHQIHFSQADLTAPLPMANSELAALHDRMAGECLTRLDRAKISSRVRELIIPRFPDGDPLRADIARAMCLSERTLQRRLQEEATSFNELVDDTRRELADQYLRDSQLTLAQVAYLLGFADQSTFFRACKRWFGTSPGEYRSRVAKGR
jgi:AraC-like DNA-binding protein